MKKKLNLFLRDENGATAIEYCLIAAGVALIIVTAVMNTSTGVGSQWNNMANNVNNALTK